MGATTTPWWRGPFPLARNAGCFLVVMGGTVLVAALAGTPRQPLRGAVVLGGFVLGAALAFGLLRRRLASGPGDPRQRAVVLGAIALEGLALSALFALGGDWAARTVALLTLLVVGVHLLPMGVAFGPRAAFLGGVCTLNALAGLGLRGVPLPVFALVDGVLKGGVGLWLLLGRVPAIAEEPVSPPGVGDRRRDG